MLVPIILSGGVGSRLWPLSRTLYPKQFHKLLGESSLLYDTIQRAIGVSDYTWPLIICNQEHRFLVLDQIQKLEPNLKIILETEQRNTAPAIALAAFYIQSKMDADTRLLILPSDHQVLKKERFIRAVKLASLAADSGKLVTFGVPPDKPETGYGYIKPGVELIIKSTSGVFSVDQFMEKPTPLLANEFVEQGYYWNSGMFLFTAKSYLTELKRFQPKIYDACERAVDGLTEEDQFIRVSEQAFLTSPSISIDYAVMEKTTNAVVVPLDAGWNDIGSWSGLMESRQLDDQGNSIQGDVITQGTTNSLVYAQTRLVATVGLDNAVVVETDDVILVADRSCDQDVKAVVDQLKKAGRQEVEIHKTVYRPWGTFRCIDQGERFQVKRLMLKPGASISLQRHQHRSEHWVVVHGQAHVTVGKKQMILNPDESVYIKKQTIHKLENKGKIELEVIEVQTGDYLGEDDIERFEDSYGRV